MQNICLDRRNIIRKGCGTHAVCLVTADITLYFCPILFIETLIQYMTILAVIALFVMWVGNINFCVCL